MGNENYEFYENITVSWEVLFYILFLFLNYSVFYISHKNREKLVHLIYNYR